MKLKLAMVIAAALSSTQALSLDNVYVATNKADGNTVALFHGDANSLVKIAEFNTGGVGTGDLEIPALQKDETHPLANGDDPLISAYGIRATDDGRYLLAVNAGDSSVSLMAVEDKGYLRAVNTVKAGDKFPVSVAVSGNKVVVASVGNTNGEGSISAYEISGGKLKAIADSRRDLKARPSTVAFSSNGDYLLVTELVTGNIKAFDFSGKTLSKKPVSTVASPRSDMRFQAIPVGFDVAKSRSGSDIVLVSEARFLTPDYKLREESGIVPQSPKYSWQTSSVSSYTLSKDGKLKLVSADVLTGQAVEGGEIANCWVEFSADNSKLWAANALSSSISTFDIDATGKATLVSQTAYKQPAQMQFLSDMKLSTDSGILYQLIGNSGELMQLKPKGNGLKAMVTTGGLPELGAYGVEVISQ